jgi:hypothetical protein
MLPIRTTATAVRPRSFPKKQLLRVRLTNHICCLRKERKKMSLGIASAVPAQRSRQRRLHFPTFAKRNPRTGAGERTRFHDHLSGKRALAVAEDRRCEIRLHFLGLLSHLGFGFARQSCCWLVKGGRTDVGWTGSPQLSLLHKIQIVIKAE